MGGVVAKREKGGRNARNLTQSCALNRTLVPVEAITAVKKTAAQKAVRDLVLLTLEQQFQTI